MVRIALILIVAACMAHQSWALDWNVCHKELAGIRKATPEPRKADSLFAADAQAVKLRDLYEDIQAWRFEYNRCRYPAEGTPNCFITQNRLNALLLEYQAGRQNFESLISRSGTYEKAKGEACGFKLVER